MTEEIETRPRRSTLRRVLKWTGITIATIIVLIIIAIFVIPLFVNTAVVKNKIEHVASEQTGREITIDGPLSFSLFPWVGFDAHDVTMANAEGFGAKPFMHAKEAEIHVKVLPLLFHHVEVSGITFDTPTLNLARKKNGRSNWQDLTGNGAEPAQKREGEKNGAPLAHLSIGHIEVNDAALDYDDAQAGKHYTIEHFGLKASDLAPDKAFPLSLKMQLSSTEPHLKARLKLETQAEFDKTASRITLAKGTLGATVSSFGGGNEPIELSAKWNRIALDENAGTATIAGLLVSLSDLKAKLDATAKQLNGKPEISGHLEIPPFSPRKVLAVLGNPVPTSLKGFDKASLSADLAAKSNALSLVNLVAVLDDSTLKGSAGIPDLSKRSLRFDLALDHINLGDYLVSGGGAKTRIGAAHGKSFMATRLPGRLLKKLDLAGKLTIGKLSGFGLEASDIGLGLNAANGTLRADPIQAKLYSGSYNGELTLAAAGQGVRLETTETLKSIDVGGLIEALYGQKRLSGTGDLQLTLAGEGATVGELMNTLKGESNFSIQNGALEGINLWDSLRRAYMLVKEHKRVPAQGPKRTEITNLKAHAVIGKGKLTNDTLVARLPFLAVSGHGTINFLKGNEVDYRLLATVVKTPKISGENLAELKSIEVPIRVSGSLSDLSAYPDLETALKARVESEVKKKLDEKKEDIKKKLLKELLGGGDDDKDDGG